MDWIHNNDSVCTRCGFSVAVERVIYSYFEDTVCFELSVFMEPTSVTKP